MVKWRSRAVVHGNKGEGGARLPSSRNSGGVRLRRILSAGGAGASAASIFGELSCQRGDARFARLAAPEMGFDNVKDSHSIFVSIQSAPNGLDSANSILG